MGYLWTQGGSVGNNDPAVSPYLKTWISGGGVVVCGITGEGTSKEIQCNWESPFEGESVGSKFQKAGGLIQAATGMTSVTSFQSRQVWGGNRPTQFNIVLQFYALRDPKSEVVDALKALETMAAANVNGMSPINFGAIVSGGNILGRVPPPVTINIGRNAIYADCVIESVSMPMDKEVNSAGYLVRAEVNLSIATMQMVGRSEVAAKYG